MSYPRRLSITLQLPDLVFELAIILDFKIRSSGPNTLLVFRDLALSPGPLFFSILLLLYFSSLIYLEKDMKGIGYLRSRGEASLRRKDMYI